MLIQWRRYWDIIYYRTYAELKAEAQVRYLGYVLWLLDPLINTVLFYVILLAMNQSTTEAVTFLLTGSIIWQWSATCFISATTSIFDAGEMLKYVYLPKVVLPLISILSNTWRFLFIFALLLIWCWCSGHLPTSAYFALPVIMLLQLLIIVGLGLPLAAIMPYFPDARNVVDAVLRYMMLISGIFFAADKLPETYRFYFHLNPLAVLIEAYRDVLMKGIWPNWFHLGYVALFGLLTVSGSIWIYKRIDLSIIKAIHR